MRRTFESLMRRDIKNSVLSAINSRGSASSVGASFDQNAMNLESIQKAVDKISRVGNPFYGYQVVVAPKYQKMLLAPDVQVTPEFRAEINQWMLDFFGYTCAVERGQPLLMEQAKTVVMHPDDYEVMVKQVEADNFGSRQFRGFL